MHEAESILVIIVSSVLALFLLVAVIVLVLIARVLVTIKRIVEHAERVIETAGEAAEMLKNVSGPLALFKLIRNIIRAVEKSRK